MKLHTNQILAIAQALDAIFTQGQYSDQVVMRVLRSNPKWGSRDRRLLAQTIYDLVRWQRFYAYISGVGDKVRDADFYGLILAYAIHREIAIPGMKAFEKFKRDQISERLASPPPTRAIAESVPAWLDQLGALQLGDSRWAKELHALNREGTVALRVNTLKADREEVQKRLAWEKVETAFIPDIPAGLRLVERKKLTHTKPFKKGLFELQDASSQLVAPALGPKPGDLVIDACAGAGGKTLHLAALMENTGKILAFDLAREKLKELHHRAKRNGVSIVETKVISAKTNLEGLRGKADKVLIDAPCSGLGVLRRKPDTKWHLTPSLLDELQTVQADILNRYSTLVKPGGTLVYATCSILPAENELQINAFLGSEAGSPFRLVNQRTIWPSEFGYDGFYIATLKKK